MAQTERESSVSAAKNTESEYNWTLWKLKKESGQSWSTAESFEILGHINSYTEIKSCPLYSLFLQPNQSLKQQESYFLFRRGIEPRWEHAANVAGGRWVYIDELNRRGDLQSGISPLNQVDEQWKFLLKAVLTMRGDGSSTLHLFHDEINGVQVDIRFSRYRIAVWARNKSREHEIGRILNGQDGNFRFPFASPTSAVFNFKSHEQPEPFT